MVGGSRSYVERAVAVFGGDLRLASTVTSIRRSPQGVEISDSTGHSEHFDHVVIAAHAPDALAMLADADAREQEILSACSYSPNDVFLHCDPSLMPKRKAAWAAWNFLREGKDADRKVAVTYWMNVLQDIARNKPVFVTLNPPTAPDPALTFARFTYDHPQFDSHALAAVESLESIQGVRRTWFAGAWTGHGFHEDGLRSGLAVAKALDAHAPWEASPVPILTAAE